MLQRTQRNREKLKRGPQNTAARSGVKGEILQRIRAPRGLFIRIFKMKLTEILLAMVDVGGRGIRAPRGLFIRIFKLN